MKKRLGFVSNSSSSSFIVAIKKEETKICECCKQKIGGESLVQLIRQSTEQSLSSDTELDYVFDNAEELMQTLKEDWGGSNALIDGTIAKLPEGDYSFLVGDVSYHDSVTKELLNKPGVINIHRGK